MTVAREGKLTKRDTGRWAVDYGEDDFDEITSGDMFELKVLGVWQKARMESFQGKYYSVPELPLKVGLIARYIGRSIGF
jgi:hypothetical protein